jgi:hypothetical protein
MNFLSIFISPVKKLQKITKNYKKLQKIILKIILVLKTL